MVRPQLGKRKFRPRYADSCWKNAWVGTLENLIDYNSVSFILNDISFVQSAVLETPVSFRLVKFSMASTKVWSEETFRSIMALFLAKNGVEEIEHSFLLSSLGSYFTSNM